MQKSAVRVRQYRSAGYLTEAQSEPLRKSTTMNFLLGTRHLPLRLYSVNGIPACAPCWPWRLPDGTLRTALCGMHAALVLVPSANDFTLKSKLATEKSATSMANAVSLVAG